MGFFETLRTVVADDLAGATRPRTEDATGSARSSDDVACWYDRTEWRKKLQRILDGLPQTRPEWNTLVSEARALKFDPAWVKQCEREEFLFMIRRAVSDRVVSVPDHEKLEQARQLIGMSDPDAESALRSIVAEADSIFNTPVHEDV